MRSFFKSAFFCLITACCAQLQSQQIYVMMTTAVLPSQYELRKEEYLSGFYAIKSYGFEPWIIEATNTGSSFFDEISKQVLYPQKNNDLLRNKGVNETMSMRTSLPYLPFRDEDIVIKLTGRYLLYDRSFIDIIEATSSDYDAYVCYGKHFVSRNHIFTGCFAMRWKYFKQIINEMDFEKAERDLISVEQLFAEFIQNQNLRIKVVDPLHIRARISYLTEIMEF